MTTLTRPSQRVSLLAWPAFVLACALNLYGIYAPSQPGPPMFEGADKVFHLASFALVMATGVLAGIPARWLAIALVAHAIGSELVQHLLLPNRSGDPIDVLADAVGIAVGWLVISALLRWWPRPSAAPAGTDPDR